MVTEFSGRSFAVSSVPIIFTVEPNFDTKAKKVLVIKEIKQVDKALIQTPLGNRSEL